MVQFDIAAISPARRGKLELEMGRLFCFLFSFFFLCFFLKKIYMSYIPCIIGFPVEAIEFTPMHTKSPKPVFAV